VALSVTGIFTMVLPLFFADMLSPIYLSSVEILSVSMGYFLMMVIYIYLSERKMKTGKAFGNHTKKNRARPAKPSEQGKIL
jgi:uncharacterized protein YqhQ